MSILTPRRRRTKPPEERAIRRSLSFSRLDAARLDGIAERRDWTGFGVGAILRVLIAEEAGRLGIVVGVDTPLP